MFLHEFKCVDCKAILLLERSKGPERCPYCEGDLDYAPGRIEPVMEYTPRNNLKTKAGN